MPAARRGIRIIGHATPRPVALLLHACVTPRIYRRGRRRWRARKKKEALPPLPERRAATLEGSSASLKKAAGGVLNASTNLGDE